MKWSYVRRWKRGTGIYPTWSLLGYEVDEEGEWVAYVRVSTASSAQLHSYEFQEQYWRERFADDPDAELVAIYADKARVEVRRHLC